jgi:hypothetical protein
VTGFRRVPPACRTGLRQRDVPSRLAGRDSAAAGEPHYQPGDLAPAQLAADLAAQDTHVEVAVLDFGDTWTAA